MGTNFLCQVEKYIILFFNKYKLYGNKTLDFQSRF
jgi:hypothetical protein